jgi:hypothetical protein
MEIQKRFLPWLSPAHGKALLETPDLDRHVGLPSANVKCRSAPIDAAHDLVYQPCNANP